ncbi:MAG: carbohydrate ABC transporter permease [Propionibacteriaceae bacterium]
MTTDVASRPPTVKKSIRRSERIAGRRGKSARFREGPVIWLLPSLIVLIVVSVYPLIFAIVNSFRFYNLGVSSIPGKFNGVDNYIRAVGDPAFRQSLANTLEFSFTVTLAELLLGVGIALLLRPHIAGIHAVRALFVLPVAIAPAVAGLAFRSLYTSGTGLIAVLLERFGVAVPAAGILGNPNTAMPALMVTDIWQWTPFVTLIALAAMQGIPHDVVEAARIDGAGAIRIFFSITLPLIGPALATVVVLRFIQSFNVFDIVYVLTRGGPAGSTATIGFQLFMEGMNNYNIGYASALTVIAALIVGVFITAYHASSVRRAA